MTLALSVFILPAVAASVVSLGPRGMQTLVAEQLFNRGGRWYLMDEGACYTYLTSPHTRFQNGRLVLMARLTSRLGQVVGDSCLGADFTSNVTVSGKLRGGDGKLVLDDIRIDHVDDEATRNALELALQLAPQALPHSVGIDVAEMLRKQVLGSASLPMHLDQFHILNIATRPDGIVIEFDLSLSTP